MRREMSNQDRLRLLSATLYYKIVKPVPALAGAVNSAE